MAIEEVSELEPALPDVFEDASTSAHYGSAAKNVGTGVANPTLSVYTKGTAAATGKAHQQLKIIP